MANVQKTRVKVPAPAEATRLWDELGDVPVDDDGLLEEPFLDFEAGTDREEVWAWFEEKWPGLRVYDLMFPNG